jgi:hypothetical protein
MTKKINLLNLQRTPIGSADVLNSYQSSSANTVPILLVQCEAAAQRRRSKFLPVIQHCKCKIFSSRHRLQYISVPLSSCYGAPPILQKNIVGLGTDSE